MSHRGATDVDQADPEALGRPLPSGRSVVLRVGPDAEELEVRDPDGRVEVRILLTDAGPVVQVAAARLEIASAEAISLRCGRFAVEAQGEVRLDAAELRVRTRSDIHLDGAVVRLNCDPDRPEAPGRPAT